MTLRYCARQFHRLAFFIALAAIPLLSQTPQPDRPFEAVHYLWIDVQQPNAEKTILAAMASLNQAITNAGCPGCTYHLWKVVDSAQGAYNYVQMSNWPSNAVYDKVHDSAEYVAASKNWGNLRSVVAREIYIRQVEIQPDK